MKNLDLIEKLKSYQETTVSWIAISVIEEALSSEDIIQFFDDLLNYGCISWMIGWLIYYKDTHDFFDTHYEEIESLRFNFQEEWLLQEYPESDYKNWFSWFCFEEVARKVANDLNLKW